MLHSGSGLAADTILAAPEMLRRLRRCVDTLRTTVAYRSVRNCGAS